MSIKLFFKNIIYRCLFLFPNGRNRAIILMYHSIGDNDVYFTVKTEEFLKQIDYLAKNSYNVVTFYQLIELFKVGKIPPKTVVLTFDDGYKDNYKNAYPILKKYNFSATIFLVTGFIGKKIPNSSGGSLAALNWDEIMEMNMGGLIDFEPHTVYHQKNYLSDRDGLKENIERSKSEVEQRLFKQCNFFAYPSGKFNNSIINILKQQGFIAAVTTRKGIVKNGDDLFLLNRNSIDSRINLNMFKTIVKRGRIN